MDKNTIRDDLLRANPVAAGTVDALKGETLFVCKFLIRAVDSLAVASTAQENNVAPGVCCRGLEGTQL